MGGRAFWNWQWRKAVEEGGEMFKLKETGNLKSRGLLDTFYQGQ